MTSFYASLICAAVAGIYYASAIAGLYAQINAAFAPVFGG